MSASMRAAWGDERMQREGSLQRGGWQAMWIDAGQAAGMAPTAGPSPCSSDRMAAGPATAARAASSTLPASSSSASSVGASAVPPSATASSCCSSCSRPSASPVSASCLSPSSLPGASPSAASACCMCESYCRSSVARRSKRRPYASTIAACAYVVGLEQWQGGSQAPGMKHGDGKHVERRTRAWASWSAAAASAAAA